MVDLTTQLPGSGGGGNAGSSFSDLYFNIHNETDPTKLIGFDASLVGTGTRAVVRLPTVLGTGNWTSVFAEISNNFADAQSITDSGGVCLNLISSQVSSGGAYIVIQDSASTFALSLMGPPSGFAAARSRVALDASGTEIISGDGADPPAAGHMGSVNRTAQTADIASVKLTNATAAGQYLVLGELECTTGGVGAGAVTVTLSWTNDSGAKTSAMTQTLVSTGSTAIIVPAYLASGDISWAVTHTGIYSTSAYALRMRIVSAG